MPFSCFSTPDMFRAAFIRAAKCRMKELNISRKELAYMASCDVSNVAHVLNGKRPVTMETMYRLGRQLGLEMQVSFAPIKT